MSRAAQLKNKKRVGRTYSYWGNIKPRIQRKKWISLKWKITQNARSGGSALYDTDHVEYDNPEPLSCQWEDVMVPDPDKKTIWNMTLLTVRLACWEKAEEEAQKIITDRLTQAEKKAELNRTLNFRDHLVKIPGTKFSEFKSRPPLTHDSLGGKTRSEAVELEFQRIMREDRPIVSEGWEIDPHYAYGIGVHAVVACDILDRVQISAFIGRFMLQQHNKSHINKVKLPTPILEQWLPTKSSKETYDEEGKSSFLLNSHQISI